MKTVLRGEPEEDLPEAVRELLEQRAARIRARPSVAEVESASLWVAELAVGDETYALPLGELVTALPLRGVTPVPLAPAHVVGILRYEVQILPVYSLASLVGVRGWRQDPAILLVLEPRPGRRVVVDCEEVPKATALPLALVEEARSRAEGAVVPVVTAALAQIHLIDDVLGLLDLARRPHAR